MKELIGTILLIIALIMADGNFWGKTNKRKGSKKIKKLK